MALRTYSKRHGWAAQVLSPFRFGSSAVSRKAEVGPRPRRVSSGSSPKLEERRN